MARLLEPAAAAGARPARLLPATQMTRAAVRANNRWTARLAGAPPWLDALAARLSRALHRPVALRADPLRTDSTAPSGEGQLALPLEVEPGGETLWLELDSDLAAAAVDALLAGEGRQPTVLRPLSELERGALSYLVLLACRELQQRTGRRLRLLSLGNEGAVPVDAPHLVQPVRVGLGELRGELRLRIPLGPTSSDELGEPPLLGGLAAAVLTSPVELRAVVGYGSLPYREIRLLSPGDLLFLDSLSVDAAGAGEAWLVCGRAGHALVCDCAAGDRAKRLTLREPASARRLAPLQAPLQEPPHLPQPEETDTMSDNKETSDSTAADTVADTVADAPAAPMLDDVPVTLTLELGRLQLSARELLSLRQGHVIELDRGHDDPLEVSVNGQTVAQGELVEVEGRLGVRIARLVGR